MVSNGVKCKPSQNPRLVTMLLLEIEYLVSLPSPEATAARLRSALVAAPTRPLPRSARPSGTRGMYPPLGLQPTSRAQTPCRMVVAISTTVKSHVNFWTYVERGK